MKSIFANIKIEIPQTEKKPEKPRKVTGYIFKKKVKENKLESNI